MPPHPRIGVVEVDLILVVADSVPAVAEVAVVTILAVVVVEEAVAGMLVMSSGMTRAPQLYLLITLLPRLITFNMTIMMVISITMTTPILENTLAWYST